MMTQDIAHLSDLSFFVPLSELAEVPGAVVCSEPLESTAPYPSPFADASVRRRGSVSESSVDVTGW